MSEAPVAKFKDVKLLEQEAHAPAIWMDCPGGRTKERKQTSGQKGKRIHDLDDETDLYSQEN